MEMAQQVKSSHKHKDISLNPQYPCKAKNGSISLIAMLLQRQNRKKTHKAASLWTRDPVSNKTERGVIPKIILSPMYTSCGTYTPATHSLQPSYKMEKKEYI